ncbi:MAG: winged helix-turn-helix domain-containing protein [Bryobacteraceae bacterium]
MPAQRSVRAVRFGDYELDLESKELRKHDHKVPVPDQALRILAMLLERPGEIVTREQLIARLWPGTTVDFDHGINSSVRRLRAVLNDSAERPRYIETLPKRGYRFIFPVQTNDQASDGEPEPLNPSAAQAARNGGTWIWGAAGVLAFCALAAFALSHWRNTQTQPINSIAILPLVNTTRDPSTDYLSDGVSEEIINSLSAAPHLKVIARTSAFRFKGKEIDPRRVGRELGVEAVLTGTLTRRQEALVIQTDLIQVSDGSELWGAKYNRPLSQLPGLQSDVAAEIARKLRLKLGGAQEKRLSRRYTENREAYELYLRAAMAGRPAFSPEGLPLLQQAIARDPNFALAYVRMANLYVNLATIRRLSTQEALPKGREAARKALELDEDLGEAHIELARVAMDLDWDWPGAERELKRGIELNANIGHIFYSWYLTYVGRNEEALAEAQRAEEIDPLSPDMQGRIAFVYYSTRRYDRAIEKARAPGASRIAKHAGAFALAETGNYAESIAILTQEIASLHIDPSRAPAGDYGHLGYAYARAGQRAKAEQICRELQERAKREGLGAYEVAFIDGVLGRKDEAFRWLEIAYQQHDAGLKHLKVDPSLDPLRADVRFSKLVRRVGLPP